MDSSSLPHNIHARYEIGQVLGQGGYATVRQASSKVDGTLVALKMMNRDNLDTNAEKNIRNEVSLLQSLNHPNIVRGFDFFEEPKMFYFVLEKVDGGELFDRIVRKTHYNELEARQLVRTILSGIKYCHDRNIVHRDLKPENLLMVSKNDDADVKIVDFGFAAKVKGMSLSKQCGTPGYVAPEILENKLHGTPVDMWSFGVILFILLGGYPPFHDNDQKMLYRKIRTASYEFHPKYWSGISEDAKDLIHRLLFINPLQRYTVDQALSHPWLHIPERMISSRHLDINIEEMKKFNAGRKLKAGIKAVVAVSKLKKIMGSLINMREAMLEEQHSEFSLNARYIINDNDILGEGGNAIVKSGTSKIDSRPVAIKIIKHSILDNDLENNIRNEMSILQSLKHNNIINAYELFDENNHFYFILEKLSGGELFDRIIQKTIYNESEARRLVMSLLSAIQYCHANHVVHRDLKPENLLMVSAEDDADVKIADFGFAAVVHGNTLTNQCGTPGYIAPEILLGKPHGTQVDMWSFGVILYILLGGYPPFHDENQKELFRKIKAGVYEFHPQYWNNISAEAKDLISKLLIVNPLERLTATQALSHPWLLSTNIGNNLNNVQNEIRKYQVTKRFKKGVNAVRAVNKMRKLMNNLTLSKELPHTIEARYTIGDVLGEGGYAIVRTGISKINSQEVAIKVMSRQSITKETEISIRKEVEILQSLDHSNIVGALDFFEESNNFYFILEKVNGGELFDRIVLKTFYNEKEARDLVRVLLDTLKYMHGRKIAHRDLKPENLLMTSADDDADVKIVDFGFAAYTDGGDLSDQCGTPGYIAPEILLNKLHDTQVDMWSLGVILYILLGGYPPFHDEDQAVLFQRIKAGVYEFHEEFWSGVSPEAKDLIAKLLVVNPLERLTATQALYHPWFLTDEERLATLTLDSAQAEMRKFQAKKRFKKGVNAIRAINRMKNLFGGLGKAKSPKAADSSATAAVATDGTTTETTATTMDVVPPPPASVATEDTLPPPPPPAITATVEANKAIEAAAVPPLPPSANA